MKKKSIFTGLRILISIGLLVYVCTRINFRDVMEYTIKKKDGAEIQGVIYSETADLIKIKTPQGEIVEIMPEEIIEPKTVRVSEYGLFTLLGKVNFKWFIPAFVVLGLIILIAALRWWLLLRAQGITLSYKDVFRLTYLGFFFNNFMLGAVGGDMAKAILVSTKTKLKVKSILSIIFDRFVGFVVLSTLCVGGVIISYQREEFKGLNLIIIIGWGIPLILYLIYRYWSRHKISLGERIFSRFPFQRFFNEVKESLHNYRAKKGVLLKAAGLSLIMHLCIITANIAYGSALGIKGVPFYYYVVLIPVILFLTSLPISVGG